MGAAAAPMLIGSAMGAITNRRNPLQGALLGGVLGGVGGSFMGGFGGAGNAASTAMGTTAGGVPAAVTGVTPGATLPVAQMPVSGIFSKAPLAPTTTPATGVFAKATMPDIVSTNTSTGLIGSTTAPVTMGERFAGGMNALKSDLGALNTFASQNPVTTQVGLGAARDIMTPQPMAAAPVAGLMRGNPMPIEDQQMANFQPRPVSLI
jgi:hypothetical protein